MTTDVIRNAAISMDPNGAHVTSVETNLGELLYLSSTSAFGPGEAIRGGVPVIGPWFGTFIRLPQHGWARRLAWQLSPTDEGIDATVSGPDFDMELHATHHDSCFTMTMSAKNTSDVEQTLQLAFHPYFKVTDVRHVRVTGLDGVRYVDYRQDPPQTVVQTGDVIFEDEVNSVFLGTPPVSIVDSHRLIHVESEGTDSTVVWNPGQAVGNATPDIGLDEWSHFVCVETALLGDHQQGVVVPAGDSRSLTMTVTVEPIVD